MAKPELSLPGPGSALECTLPDAHTAHTYPLRVPPVAPVQCFTGLMSVDKFNEFVLKREGESGQVEISESNELAEAARLQLTGFRTLLKMAAWRHRPQLLSMGSRAPCQTLKTGRGAVCFEWP